MVDGTGTPSYRADIGSEGGAIAAVGRAGAPDADGLVVTPGQTHPSVVGHQW